MKCAVMLLVVAIPILLACFGCDPAGSSAAQTRMAQLEDSVVVLRKTVDSLGTLVPGLGEYMSTIQLHAAKLWFAAQSLCDAPVAVRALKRSFKASVPKQSLGTRSSSSS